MLLLLHLKEGSLTSGPWTRDPWIKFRGHVLGRGGNESLFLLISNCSMALWATTQISPVEITCIFLTTIVAVFSKCYYARHYLEIILRPASTSLFNLLIKKRHTIGTFGELHFTISGFFGNIMRCILCVKTLPASLPDVHTTHGHLILPCPGTCCTMMQAAKVFTANYAKKLFKVREEKTNIVNSKIVV